MDTEMGEAGEGTEVSPAQSDGCAKVNGDMNGAYTTEKESPMDVSDEAIVEDDRPAKRIPPAAAAAATEDVPNKEVPQPNPDLDEHISSNGFSHDGKENGDSMECDDSISEEKNSDSAPKVLETNSAENSSVVNNGEDNKDSSDSVVENDDGKPPADVASSVKQSEQPPAVEKSDTDGKKPEENGETAGEDVTEQPSKSTTDNDGEESKVESDEKSAKEEVEEPSDSNTKKKDGDEEEKKSDSVDKEGDDAVAKGDETKTEEKSEDDKNKTSEVIDIDITPEKSKKPRKSVPINVTPRRSSRNLNKQKSYIEAADNAQNSDDPDIEEIEPQDPLALDLGPDRKSAKKTTIVVSDTKRLAEIAAGSKSSKGGAKKEPTLVIIDTNSILSGRGPVPVAAHSSTTITARSSGAPSQQSHQAPSFSVLPVSAHTSALYNAQAQTLRNQHTTIKPVVMTSPSQTTTLPQIMPNIQQAPPPPPKPAPAPIVLPSLTDDMYVVEAPSFIVPYVYEKPPIKPLKEYIETLDKAIKMQKEHEKKAKEDKEKREKEEKEKKEKEEKEKELKAKEQEEEDKKKEEEEKKKEKEEIEEEGEKKEVKDVEESEKMDVDKEGEEKGESEKAKEKEEKMEVDEESSEKKEEKDDDKDKAKEKDDDVVEVKDKEVEEKPKDLTKKDKEEVKPETKEEGSGEEKKKSGSYFDNPLGKFFMQIGINLVQEHVQTDLLRSQKRKREREGSKCAPDVQVAINSLLKTLEFSKENNEPFKMELKKCEFCSFKTESQLAMAHHLETPHMRNYVYRCNFCTLEVRSPHDILFHMEAEHNVRGRLERAPAFHQCPSCPFEDNQKGKLTRHLLSCAKKYRPERNQEPPLDWEPPAKIPRVPRNRPPVMTPGSAVYQAAMTGLKQGAVSGQSGVPHPLLPKLTPSSALSGNPAAAAAMLAQAQNAMLGRGVSSGRGRPNLSSRFMQQPPPNPSMLVAAHHKAIAAQMRPGMVYRPSGSNAQPQVLLPTSYQIAGNQIYQGSTSTSVSTSAGKPGGQAAAAKLLQQQPSISITPLPRPHQASSSSSSSSSSAAASSSSSSAAAAAMASSSAAAAAAQPTHGKPGRPLGSGKATFVICEICDGYIKDLELLRNHMQWIHKVKIHPKMIYNRPPLNCQKCQFRFFTDQGLERHLLGSHGLVTSSMQEAANKGKDGGRCPVCGRVYQWKLLNHVARDHNMSLKPAHLSYKCTVCTATFGMYKQFENHVYSAHSVVAKRVMDKKTPSQAAATGSSGSSSGGASSQSESLLKPLKINDEITIIPHPPRSKTKPGPTGRVGSSSGKGKV